MSEETKTESKWRSRELGALWKRQGRNQNYLTGTIRVGEFGVEKEVKVVIFTNKNKSKNEKAPDFIVYESEPAEAKEEGEEATASVAPVVDSEEVNDEEVPELLV